MQEINQRNIQLGQRVRSELYGGKDGTVVAIYGLQKPETVKVVMVVGVTGGAAAFDIIWDDGSQSSRISEALLRGSCQWVIYDQVASGAEVEDARIKALEFNNEATRRQQEFEAAKVQAKQAAQEAHPYLKARDVNASASQQAVKNIRLVLKRCFGGVKFSVRSDHNSVDVTWDDGPSLDMVLQEVDPFELQRLSDGEKQDPARMAFTELYGGVKYLSVVRRVSNRLWQAGIDALWHRLPANLGERPKPTALQLNRWGHDPIDRLQITQQEAIQQIVDLWDDLGMRYVPLEQVSGHRKRHSWLVWDGQARCIPLNAAQATPEKSSA